MDAAYRTAITGRASARAVNCPRLTRVTPIRTALPIACNVLGVGKSTEPRLSVETT